MHTIQFHHLANKIYKNQSHFLETSNSQLCYRYHVPSAGFHRVYRAHNLSKKKKFLKNHETDGESRLCRDGELKDDVIFYFPPAAIYMVILFMKIVIFS